MRNVRSWFDSSVGETGGNPIRITVTDDILRIGDVTVKRRQPDRIVSTYLLCKNVVFHINNTLSPTHTVIGNGSPTALL